MVPKGASESVASPGAPNGFDAPARVRPATFAVDLWLGPLSDRKNEPIFKLFAAVARPAIDLSVWTL